MTMAEAKMNDNLTIREWGGSFHWSETLICFVNSMRIRSPYWIEIYLSSRSCTDMRGAINAAKAIMPTVTCIDTIAFGGIEPLRDTRYRSVGGQWFAEMFERPFPEIKVAPRQKDDTARLTIENTILREALTMVRDADDDRRRDGLPTIPDAARVKIDNALLPWSSR